MIILLKFNFYPVKWEIYIKKKKNLHAEKVKQHAQLCGVVLVF